MNTVIHVGVPLLIVLAMTIVGLELTPADLLRVLHYPMEVTAGLLCQVLLLPLIAAGLVVLLRLDPVVAGGVILTAAAPQAMTSNYYCLLGRANVALSVTLTAASSIIAVATTPLVAGLAFGLLLEPQAGFVLPAGKVMQQVVTGLLLPVAAGMLVRRYAARFVERNRVRFQRLSMIGLGVMLAIVLVDQIATIQRNFVGIMLAAVLFTAGAVALALALAKALSCPRGDTVTLVAAFPSRSLAIATLISVNVLGRVDFLSFAATFFLVQAMLLVPAMLLARERASA